MPASRPAVTPLSDPGKLNELQQLASVSKAFLSRSLLKAKVSAPELPWCDDYTLLRPHVKRLADYSFDPAFLSAALRAVARHARKGHIIPIYVLTHLMRYFNKARIEYLSFTKDRIRPLEDVLQQHYFEVRNNIFQLLQLHMHEPAQLNILNTFLINFTCTDKQVQWMVAHAADEEVLVNRLLRYPKAQAGISQWAISLLDESIWLPRKGEIIGRILDMDSSFVIPRGLIYRDLAEIEQMLYHVKRYFTFEPVAEASLFDSITLDEARRRHAPLLVSPEGDLVDENGTPASFVRERQVIPDCPITSSFLFSMGKIGFHLIGENQEVIQMLYQYKGAPGLRYAYLSGNEMYSEADPGEVFRRLDLRATMEYWLELVPLFYKKLMLWGIHYSHLDNLQKLRLYQRHTDPEVLDTLLYIADKEENIPVLEWLLGQEKA